MHHTAERELEPKYSRLTLIEDLDLKSDGIEYAPGPRCDDDRKIAELPHLPLILNFGERLTVDNAVSLSP